MLIGRYENSIDGKGRVIIPSRFRGDLGATCVLTHGPDKCLYVYPMREWEVFMRNLDDLPEEDEQVRNYVRNFYATATECDIDRQGRMTIPQSAREYAEIVKDLATVGFSRKVEIWDREKYEAKIAGVDTRELSEHIARLKKR
jgi:MraZ protein